MRNRRISDDEFVAIAGEIMSDETQLQVEIGIKEAWVLLSMLQLVCRVPGVQQTQRNHARMLAQMFEAAILALHPEAMPLIDMGWDMSHDRTSTKKH